MYVYICVCVCDLTHSFVVLEKTYIHITALTEALGSTGAMAVHLEYKDLFDEDMLHRMMEGGISTDWNVRTGLQCGAP